MASKEAPAHVEEMVAKLRAAADKLESLKGGDAAKLTQAATEVKALCCNDCIAIVNPPPCLMNCINISALL